LDEIGFGNSAINVWMRVADCDLFAACEKLIVPIDLTPDRA
jgi:hypothetical protein